MSPRGVAGGGGIPPLSGNRGWSRGLHVSVLVPLPARDACSPIEKAGPMGAGRREGVGPRPSPNGHVKNALALLTPPLGGAGAGPRPARHTCSAIGPRGQGHSSRGGTVPQRHCERTAA